MKMFGFSRRRAKIGRLKVHLSDSAQGTKSPLRPLKKPSNTNGESLIPAADNSDETADYQCASTVQDINNSASGSSESWMVLSIAGDKPMPRLNHAAAVVGTKMVVVGGESTNGMLDDVQVLSFDQFSWTTASSKIYLSPTSLPLKIPSCKGHCLVSWGKKTLLIGGKTDSSSDKISVWAFDTETECWSLMEAKGDVPVARSGHTVVKSSSVLILFGGEDSKRRKLNDLHMFDLKSMTWLPLQCTGPGPSPRSNHVSALYDDRTLYIFGGSAKSKSLNDLYSLDFETMMWSRIKIRGFHPSPRTGCCGVLCGSKWYIAGGGSRKKRHLETLVFDVLKAEWSVATTSPPSSITTNKGFSLVIVRHKEKDFLVAFGGAKKEPTNQVEVLILEKNGNTSGRRFPSNKIPGPLLHHHQTPSNDFASHLTTASSCPVDSLRQNLASIIEDHGSSRRSLSESVLGDATNASGNNSCRKQCSNEDELARKLSKTSEDDSSFLQFLEQRKPPEVAYPTEASGRSIMESAPSLSSSGNMNVPSSIVEKFPLETEETIFPEGDGKSSVYQLYETRMAALIRKNGMLEGQLAAAVASREAAEKNLSAALKGSQESEKKLEDVLKDMELLKEKLAGMELAQEEANNLSSIVHGDNVRLEHDVAFLKAVLDDTQKELHSTRGVLANERARAFQLQVEVFHLKQRLQSMENRTGTQRKPFQV